MKFGIYLLLAALLFGVWKTHRSVQRSESAEERFFAIRASVFTWLVGSGFVAAFIFLPNRLRIILLLPAFVAVVSLMKFWQNSRARLRRESQERVDIDRMKRVN